MRVAWVLYGELTQLTGGTIYDAEVVAGLRSAGDKVSVISLPARGPRIAGAMRIAREVRAVAAEVVVGDELCFRELAVAFRLLRGAEVKRVLLVHHLTSWEKEIAAPRRAWVGARERLAIGGSDRVITTSETTRARLLAEGVRKTIDVVLPGADRLMREREREPELVREPEPERVRVRVRDGRYDGGRERDVRVVFVGAVTARKKVVELVRAFAEGAHAKARLVLVGSTRDENYAREVRRAVVWGGVVERVTFTGEVDERGVADALAEADVLVMPSSLEGYGIAATEAIRAGVPVIAARAQGLEEALAPCPAATVLVDDEAALGRALARFAGDVTMREAMQRAAREAADRMPTWAQCAASFRASLERIVSAKG